MLGFPMVQGDIGQSLLTAGIRMSPSSRRSLRRTALATATAAALAFATHSAVAAPDAVINTSALQSAESHDRFIVKYREGSAEHASDRALERSLQAAATATLHGTGLELRKLRRTATGAEV